MVDVAPAAGIVVFMYLLAEILKRTILKNSDLVAILPFLCGLCGAIIAVILYYVDPSILGVNDMLSSVVTGACSGLVATGANQVYKQFYKLTSVGHSVATEVQQEVSNMTTEEKKEYLKGVKGVSLASDAFFPFRDNIDRAARSGVEYVSEPGGSVRDDAVIQSANEHGMTMFFTGVRLFHH